MNEDEINDFFNTLEEFFVSLGVEKDSISKESVDEATYLVMNCRLGSDPLQFIGCVDENWGYVILRYPFDIVENLAVDLQVNDEQERLESFQDGKYVESARNQLEKLEIDWNELKYGLSERLVSENCYFNLDQTGDLPLKGFNVDKRIFPHEGMKARELDDAIETVVGRAGMGRLWIANCLGKTDEFFSTSHTDIETEDSENEDLSYIK